MKIIKDRKYISPEDPSVVDRKYMVSGEPSIYDAENGAFFGKYYYKYFKCALKKYISLWTEKKDVILLGGIKYIPQLSLHVRDHCCNSTFSLMLHNGKRWNFKKSEFEVVDLKNIIQDKPRFDICGHFDENKIIYKTTWCGWLSKKLRRNNEC